MMCIVMKTSALPKSVLSSKKIPFPPPKRKNVADCLPGSQLFAAHIST